MRVNRAERFRQLSANLAHYRRLRGLTQDQLAEMVNISKNHLSRVESLNSPDIPSLDLLFDIAEALDVEVGKFFEIREI